LADGEDPTVVVTALDLNGSQVPVEQDGVGASELAEGDEIDRYGPVTVRWCAPLVENSLRAIVFVVGFAVIGTIIAVILRSTPIARGVGLL
jgi:hypothetical protein